MSGWIGPSHFVYFSFLHRRNLWLGQLVAAFEPSAHRTWPARKAELDTKYASLFRRLPSTGKLGIAHPLPLQNSLDDTPVESFLANTARDLAAYESELFTLMISTASDPLWHEALGAASLQWGRELAQECLLTPAATHLGSGAMFPLFELYRRYLEGGEFGQKALLKRRSTNNELQYELRDCPHRRFEPDSAAIACRLESMVYKGFAQVLVPGATHTRREREGFCMDTVHLEAGA